MSSPYLPPLEDMRFALEVAGGGAAVLALPAYKDFSHDVIDTILDEGARFATEVLSPLNQAGDRQGCRLEDNKVLTPNGFKEAYGRFCQNGWNSAPVPAEYGGQGLPTVTTTLLSEMYHGANMALGLCPMLTKSAIDLLSHYGSTTLKDTYLPNLVSGKWTGTMCMTEPQAGSDVGAVRSLAEKIIPSAAGRGWSE